MYPFFRNASVSASARYRSKPVCSILAFAFVIGAPALSMAQVEDAPFNERPADANVVIENSPRYEGAFGLSTLARVCGEVPAELNFSGIPSFIVQFYPEDGQGAVRDITFSSNELVGGVELATGFMLSVIVYSPKIGSPPAYVLDTSRSGVSGTARLSSSEEGALKLDIEGVNEAGEQIRLLLTCWPRDLN